MRAVYQDAVRQKRSDLRKLGYKFRQADIKEFTELLKNGFYHSLPLKDFSGQNIVYLSSIAQVRLSAAKVLLMPQNSTQLYGVKAMEEEIVSTFTIEQVDFIPATASARSSPALLPQTKAKAVFSA